MKGKDWDAKPELGRVAGVKMSMFVCTWILDDGLASKAASLLTLVPLVTMKLFFGWEIVWFIKIYVFTTRQDKNGPKK
jgi:hypothetical protein